MRRPRRMGTNCVSRALLMAFGYAYPAYKCYKSVEKSRAHDGEEEEEEQLQWWCKYWILIAVLTICDRICDTFLSWIPMYNEAKLAFYIYLWYSKTKGTAYAYDAFFRPYVAGHETEIDENLAELKTKVSEIAGLCFEKVSCYGKIKFMEALRFVSTYSSPAISSSSAAIHDGSNHLRPGASSDRHVDYVDNINHKHHD